MVFGDQLSLLQAFPNEYSCAASDAISTDTARRAVPLQ